MPEVDRYRIVLYGSCPEHPDLKAKIELYQRRGEALASVGKIRFHEGPLPADEQKKGDQVMNLPRALLGEVVDVLRYERPIYFSFHEGRGVLGTGIEPVGTRDESVPQLVRVMPGEASAPAGTVAPEPTE